MSEKENKCEARRYYVGDIQNQSPLVGKES